jgi:E1A/CREB-binding protein
MFTVDQIEMHLRSTAADMARAPPPKGSQPQGGPEEQCHICKAQHILRFEPPPKNCVSCGARIKRNQTYYQHFKPDAIWCQACFNAAGDNLYVENLAILKGEVADKKQRNEQHEDEEWVNCDNPNCNKWVHIICGLFNKVCVVPCTFWLHNHTLCSQQHMTWVCTL